MRVNDTHLRYELAAFRFKTALANYVEWRNKAGFRSDQPRWPKGSGEISGRWSGGGGTTASDTASESAKVPSRGGHHFVNKELYNRLPFRPETRKVFEQAVTGPLHGGTHGWSKEHEIYNEAVEEHFNRFVTEHNIAPEDVTPAQARKFIDEVKRTSDPRIRRFNLRIYMREVIHWMRRMPRAPE